MLILRLILLLLILCYRNAFLFNSAISATIEKYWYSVGDSVEIYCNSTDETLDDLYFIELESHLPLNETDVNYSVTNVNKNAILLHVYNVTAGKYNYVCKSNKRKENTFNIGVASFQVGYPPKIKSLSFEYIDFNQLSMLMTPSISRRYWKTTWKLSENSSQEFIYDQCSCFNQSQYCLCEDPFHCNISGEGCFHSNVTYQFTILGSNYFGLFNQTYLISPTLKIAKLENLKWIKTFADASSISLSWFWEAQDLWPSSAIRCKVSYQIPTEELTKSYLTDENEMTFTDLLPDTRYLLTLRCKLQESYYWSDVIQIFEKTSSFSRDEEDDIFSPLQQERTTPPPPIFTVAMDLKKMNAVHLYLTTCRYVLQAEEYVAELYGLLSYLRQVLSCCVCGHLLRRPLGTKPNVCQHFVCTECSGNKMKLKPSCSWCKDSSEFVENTQISILVHCFKKLCEYLYSSRLVHDLIQSNGETNGLVLLVQEAIAFDDNYSSSMEGKLSVLPYMELLPSQKKEPLGINTLNKLSQQQQQPTSSNNSCSPFISRTPVSLFSTKITNTNDEIETTSKHDSEKQSYFISARNTNKSSSNQQRGIIVQGGNVREKCAPILERRKRSLWNSRGELACLEPGRHEDDDDDKDKNGIELNKQNPAVCTAGDLFLDTETPGCSGNKKIKLDMKEPVGQ